MQHERTSAQLRAPLCCLCWCVETGGLSRRVTWSSKKTNGKEVLVVYDVQKTAHDKSALSNVDHHHSVYRATITHHTANVQRPTYNSIAVYSTLFERNVTALLRNGPAVGLCVKECCIPAHAGRRNIKRLLRTMSIQQISLAALRYYVLTSVNLKTFSRSYKYCT